MSDTPVVPRPLNEFAAAIAAAFQPGMAQAVMWAEAEDRARNQAKAIGSDPDAVIDRAKFRYIETPSGGIEVWRDILDDIIREETIHGR